MNMPLINIKLICYRLQINLILKLKYRYRENISSCRIFQFYNYFTMSPKAKRHDCHGVIVCQR